MKTHLTPSATICGLTLISDDGCSHSIFVLTWAEVSFLHTGLGEALGLGAGMKEVGEDAVEDLRPISEITLRTPEGGV